MTSAPPRILASSEEGRSQTYSYIRLRIYHEFEKPRSGREVIIPAIASSNSPEASVSDIEEILSEHNTLSKYIPHVYDGIAECFTPLSALTTTALHAEHGPGEHAPSAAALPRIDIKLMSTSGNERSTTMDGEALASRLTCDSSDTALTSTWFGIGILRGKTAANHGTLWRSALQFGASMTFTIGRRYERRVEGSADVYKTLRQIPCLPYPDVAAFMATCPVDAQVVVIEYGGIDLIDFEHPKRAVYVLGSEDSGVPPTMVARAQWHVSVPTADGRPNSLNVAATGAIVMYDRFIKMNRVNKEKNKSSITNGIAGNALSVKERLDFDNEGPSY